MIDTSSHNISYSYRDVGDEIHIHSLFAIKMAVLDASFNITLGGEVYDAIKGACHYHLPKQFLSYIYNEVFDFVKM